MHLHKRKVRDTAVVITMLMGVNVAAHFSNLNPWVVIPAGAVALVALARGMGLTWGDLGVRRSSIGRGLAYGGTAAALVIAVVAAGVALPFTREFFLNDAYASMRTALFAALIIIPLTTVLPEELLFRGVLQGSLERFGVKTAFIGGSVLFGLWHVATSLNLTAGNAGLSALLGTGSFGKWMGVALAVVATSLAGAGFIWLRHRTDSVLAPVSLHWALNAVGALAAATAFQFQ